MGRFSGRAGRRCRALALLLPLCAVIPVRAVQPGGGSAHRAATSAAPDVAAADPQQPLDADDARFFLTRTGFAPDAAEVAQYVGLTREQAVDRVLAGVRGEAVTPLPDWVDEPLPTIAQRRAWTPDERLAWQKANREHYRSLRAWWIQEMATTPSPLTERMTLFWHGHFTSGQDKVPDPQLMARQNALLRRDAFGSFGTLLHDAAKDPAMLRYLDGASNRKGRPNENFAREVMELFTLGEGHYSQHDVTEAARAYTGWSIDPDTQTYRWRPAWHDDGIKTVLGHTGRFNGDDVLDILLDQPETASFITAGLWREFVSDTPDPAELAPIAAHFRASGYDIKTVLRDLFLSPAFWNEANRGVLVKSPAEFVVGTLRAFDVGYGSTQPFVGTMNRLGETLFYPPNVKGWPGGETWINSSTLLARKQFVEQLFRATEAASRPSMRRGFPASAGAAMPRRVAMRMGGGMRFDLDAWLARYHAKPEVAPNLSAQLQLQHAVLPLEPVDAIDAGASGGSYLEALLMDPAYQLK